MKSQVELIQLFKNVNQISQTLQPCFVCEGIDDFSVPKQLDFGSQLKEAGNNTPFRKLSYYSVNGLSSFL